MKIGKFELIDVRSILPSRAGSDRRAIAELTSATLHYFGPPVNVAATPAAERAYLHGIATGHMARIWGRTASGAPIYGPGIAYDFAYFPKSQRFYYLRDLTHVKWHCANADGNRSSIAVHVAQGEGQQISNDAWATLGDFFDALGQDYGFTRDEVLGHCEWPKYTIKGGKVVQIPNSTCPGLILLSRLEAWRDGSAVSNWRVIVAKARVRTAPNTDSPIALDGQMIVGKDHTFLADNLVRGEYVAGSDLWVHRKDGIGFVHISLLDRIG